MIDSDSQLIHKAKSGNKHAFGILVKKYQEKILYLAYDLTGSYEEAKDIAQEAFLKAFRKLGQFEERSKFSTWMHRITYNLAIDYHRRKQRNPHQSIDEDPSSIQSTPALIEENAINSLEKALEVEEVKAQLEAAIQKLSPNQRTATVLRYFHQKSSKEIAEIMNCAESTVRIHIFRALSNLKILLSRSNEK